jgi:hypothetical protein
MQDVNAGICRDAFAFFTFADVLGQAGVIADAKTAALAEWILNEIFQGRVGLRLVLLIDRCKFRIAADRLYGGSMRSG